MQALQLTLGDYAMDANLMPAWDYFTQQEFLTDHVLTFQFHYHDCDCAACYSAHFPCENPLCDYCDSVRRLKAEGYKIEKEVQGIIDYATYIASGFEGSSGDNGATFDTNYDMHDMLWRTCANGDCPILVDGKTADLYDGSFCSQECMDAVAEDQVFYCAECGDNEVENEGDICQYCEESQYDDDSGFLMAEVIDSEYYDQVENCWIAPNGDLHYVPYCNHETTACKLGFGGVSSCECAGYIHVSVYWSRIDRFHFVPRNPTHMQKETARLYAESNGIPLPESLIEYDAIEHENPVIVPMQNLSPAWLTMKRSMRDRFYPLSGD